LHEPHLPLAVGGWQICGIMSERESSARQRWGHIIDRQRASGLSVAAFCRQHAVPVSSLYAWKRRLAISVPPHAIAVPRHAFVEAKIAAISATGEDAGRIDICLYGGRRLRVGRGFDPHLLRDVIAVLESLPASPEGLPSTSEDLR
jgi:hypothetical protein